MPVPTRPHASALVWETPPLRPRSPRPRSRPEQPSASSSHAGCWPADTPAWRPACGDHRTDAHGALLSPRTPAWRWRGGLTPGSSWATDSCWRRGQCMCDASACGGPRCGPRHNWAAAGTILCLHMKICLPPFN